MTVESLTPITEAELLAKVKQSLNITGEQFDATLQMYVDEVKAYLAGAGVRVDVLGSTLAVGCISRGVADLWNYGNGDTKLSEYFYQRAEQLRSVKAGYLAKNITVHLYGSVIKNRYTVQEETRLLDIGVDGYNYTADSLALYVNGLKFDESKYTVVDNNAVRLSLPVVAGTAVEFVVTKLEKAVADNG